MNLKITIIDIQNEIKFHQILELTIALKNFFGNKIDLTFALKKFLEKELTWQLPWRKYLVAQLTWQLPWQLCWKNDWLDNCLDLKISLTPMPSVQCDVWCVQVCSVKFAVCRVYFKVCTEECAVCSAQRAVHSVCWGGKNSFSVMWQRGCLPNCTGGL